MACLVFQAGPNAGRRYKLGEGDYIIGRRSDCQIFVPDMRVSRQHARIRRENQQWAIEDLGSNNGTYVNGQRVQSGILHDQDEIVIANNRIRVELPDAAPKGRSEYDAHVTVVDLKSPSLVLSSEDASDSQRFWHSSAILAGVQDSLREQRLLERKLSAISSILEIAARSHEPNQLLDALCGALLELFPSADSVGVLVEDEKTRELKAITHRSRRANGPQVSDIRVPGTIIQHVVQDKRGILLHDASGAIPVVVSGTITKAAGTTALSTTSSPTPATGVPTDGKAAAVATAAVETPAGSRMGAPIQAHNSHYGVFYVESAARAFRQEDVDLLTSVAAQAGLAIHATRMQHQVLLKQRLERDLRVARQIQRSLLPAKPPDVVGLEFAVHYEPAYEIGGDFYDFIWHDKSHLAIVIGDVAGKAISAALYMARLTSELRSRAGIARTPARLLRRVNQEMLQLGDEGMFATLTYAIYDLSSRTLVFTNAGHVVPLLRREGRVYPLHAERAHVAPIGVMPQMEVGEARVQLHSGDLLVLTTDGIHEARDAQGNEYGIKRLSRRIRSARGGPDDVVKAILQDVDSHVASGSQGDDITIVVMGVGAKRARRRTDTIPGVAPGDPLPPEPEGEPGEPESPEA
ncbi:MAG TPA: SpoIIE family protein phosphatase [Kofleriaceae bacterium]|nr:SpoIIE family protein phosphatase [Kofleriaceae bacterium]